SASRGRTLQDGQGAHPWPSLRPAGATRSSRSEHSSSLTWWSSIFWPGGIRTSWFVWSRGSSRNAPAASRATNWLERGSGERGPFGMPTRGQVPARGSKGGSRHDRQGTGRFRGASLPGSPADAAAGGDHPGARDGDSPQRRLVGIAEGTPVLSVQDRGGLPGRDLGTRERGDDRIAGRSPDARASADGRRWTAG